MRGENFLDRAGREPVARDVDDIVGSRHHVYIAVLVDKARITGLVIAGEGLEVGTPESLLGIPQAGQGPWRQRQFAGNGADVARRDVLAALVERADLPAGRSPANRASLDRRQSDAEAVRRDRPSRFGLPPVIDDRDTELVLRPVQRVGIAAFAGKEQCPQ